jgi:NAD(P)-dependent dehydrogenase (short-subunit alcohol dehydrogenase family)
LSLIFVNVKMPSIKGQSILIIGGSSGIGAAAAQLATAEGVRVAIASSNPTRVSSAVQKIKIAVPDAHIVGYTCDLSAEDIEARLEKLFTDTTTANGALLDHIVYTANRMNLVPVSELTIEYLRNAGQLSHVAPMLIAKLAPRFLNSSYRSSVIYTSGVVGDKPVKGYIIGSYRAAGLFGFTRALALDMAPIRVNVVSPGATETEMWGDGESRAQLKQRITEMSLLGKPGSPAEVAEAYIYLMKDSNTTGATINTSGGALMQ